jgi:hypothetical protein
MIGSLDQLYNAAVGKPMKRQFVNPMAQGSRAGETPQGYGIFDKTGMNPTGTGFQSLNDIFGTRGQVETVQGGDPYAYRNQRADRMAASKRPIPGGATEFNDVYMGLLNSRPPGGLSQKGKYGGFFTADERNKAIEGGALQLSGEIPGQLRTQAQGRFNQLETMKEDAYNAYVNRLTGGGRSILGIRGAPLARTGVEGGEIDRFVNPARTYENELQSWADTNATKANAYLDAAQQFENTNLSDLAESVAMRQYGVNPSLANSLFGDFEERRNQQLWDQSAADQKAGNAQATSQIESITNYKGSTVAGLTGRSPSQLYRGINKPISWEDADGNKNKQYGYNIVEEASALIGSNDNQGAFDLASSIENAAGGAETAALIYAMLYLGGYNKENLKNKLYLSGIVSQ